MGATEDLNPPSRRTRSNQVKGVIGSWLESSTREPHDHAADFRAGDILGKRASVKIQERPAETFLCVLNCLHHRVEHRFRLERASNREPEDEIGGLNLASRNLFGKKVARRGRGPNAEKVVISPGMPGFSQWNKSMSPHRNPRQSITSQIVIPSNVLSSGACSTTSVPW